MGYTVGKEDEIGLILAAGAGYRRSVVIDLDGTLIAFQKGQAKQRTPVFRPHFRAFIDGLKPHAALFIFSAGSATRSKNIFNKYLKADFKGYFTPRHLYRGKKCLAEFSSRDHLITIVDDSSYAVHPDSRELHIHIDRWEGDPDDRGLLYALTHVRHFWLCHWLETGGG